jgi:hypothetical protein
MEISTRLDGLMRAAIWDWTAAIVAAPLGYYETEESQAKRFFDARLSQLRDGGILGEDEFTKMSKGKMLKLLGIEEAVILRHRIPDDMLSDHRDGKDFGWSHSRKVTTVCRWMCRGCPLWVAIAKVIADSIPEFGPDGEYQG